MFVICKNDYPWAVCPDGTTGEQANHIAKIKQIDFNKNHTQGQTIVYMHVEMIDILTNTQINAFLSRNE